MYFPKFRIKNIELRIKGDSEGRDLSIFGSRGEQRLAILWLKLGEMAFISKACEASLEDTAGLRPRSFIEEKSREVPVLLLDDIFSELDPPHRELVLKAVDEKQVIITTADLGVVENKWLEGVKLIKL